MALITPNRPSSGSDSIKVAVTMLEKTTQFLSISTNKPLEDTVECLCECWNLQDPGSYSLIDSDTFFYITDRNRSKLKNGAILTLSESPKKAVEKLITKLKMDEPEKRDALKQLSTCACDITFTEYFIAAEGVDLVLQFLECGSPQGVVLAYSLTAILEIMDHGLVPWDMLSPSFVSNVTEYARRTKNPVDATITQRALALLESIVMNSQVLYTVIANNILFDELIPHLSRGAEIQQCCIALMNALCLKAPPERRKRFESSLSSKEVRTAILEKVVRLQTSGVEMVHQLYVFQQLSFNLLEKKRLTPIQPNSPKFEYHKEIITEFRKIAFGDDTDHHKTNTTAFKKLGFQDCANPTNDFMRVPPGILALDCMYYFATKHNENYTRVVLENTCRGDAHECPFGKTGIALTNLLCDILHVGETPDNSFHNYHPMFFACDKSFEEFFCICIQLLNKTWRDMRATVDDLEKVLSVVREQIEFALKERPSAIESFKSKLTALNYNEILKRRQQERFNKEEMDSQAAPVVELRNKIRPDIIDLIKQQRLKYLMEGTHFQKNSKGPVAVKLFCRLSLNHKVLQYGNVAEDGPVTDEVLDKVIIISEITSLLIGNDCRMKRKGKTCFAVQHGPDKLLEMAEPHQFALDMWCDGINALLGNEMASKQTQTDLETLLGMEMKLRLLDTANVKIPTKCPPIPAPPDNFDFFYDYN